MLAARGLLKCPREYNFLLAILAEKGIDLELTKELFYNSMLSYAALNNSEKVENIRKDLLKVLFPDVKSSDEKLMQEVKQFIPDDGRKFRVSADTKTTIKDENPLARFNK